MILYDGHSYTKPMTPCVFEEKKGLNSLKSGTNGSLEVGKKICLISNVSYLAKGEEVAGSETD